MLSRVSAAELTEWMAYFIHKADREEAARKRAESA